MTDSLRADAEAAWLALLEVDGPDEAIGKISRALRSLLRATGDGTISTSYASTPSPALPHRIVVGGDGGQNPEKDVDAWMPLPPGSTLPPE